MIQFNLVTPRTREGGGTISLAEHLATGHPVTVEWILRQYGDVGIPLEIPEGRRVGVSIHGEASILVSDDGAEWEHAREGEACITSGGDRTISGTHKYVRPEYLDVRRDPARSLLPGANLNPLMQPVRVELTVR